MTLRLPLSWTKSLLSRYWLESDRLASLHHTKQTITWRSQFDNGKVSTS